MRATSLFVQQHKQNSTAANDSKKKTKNKNSKVEAKVEKRIRTLETLVYYSCPWL